MHHMSALLEFAVGAASVPMMYGGYKGIYPRLSRKPKRKFYVRAEQRVNGKDDGVLIWVTRTSQDVEFPDRAESKIEWRGTRKHYNFCTIAWISSNDPDAEEKVLEAVVEAKALASDWERPHSADVEEMLKIAERAIER